MIATTLTLFVIACIIYFIANIVYGFGLFIEKKIKEKKNKKFINNKDMTEELKQAGLSDRCAGDAENKKLPPVNEGMAGAE